LPVLSQKIIWLFDLLPLFLNPMKFCRLKLTPELTPKEIKGV
jgi:hypothetical protein